MNLKISIIIPVYNSEEYLKRCLNSILKQTYTNLEIFLIDDGSSDNSGSICDEYSKTDRRFITIHQQNQGTSSARNKGLSLATGNFIGFMDSDDFINPDMYEKLISLAVRENLKLVTCEFKNTQGFHTKIWSSTDNPELINIDEYLSGMKYLPNGIFNVWSKLIAIDLAKKKSFIFGKIHQDALYMSEILGSVENIGIIKEPLYNYNVENQSITRSKYSKRRVEGIDVILKTHENLIKLSNTHEARQSIRIWFLEWLLGHYSNLSINKQLDKNKKYRNKLFNLIKENYKKEDINKRAMLVLNLNSDIYGVIYKISLIAYKFKKKIK